LQRYVVDLLDVQQQAGPKRRQRRVFLFGDLSVCGEHDAVLRAKERIHNEQTRSNDFDADQRRSTPMSILTLRNRLTEDIRPSNSR
jgi:hypothetical protein